MKEVVWVKAHPRHPATAAPVEVLLAGGGQDRAYRHPGDGRQYRAGIVQRPLYSASRGFGRDGFDGVTRANSSSIVFSTADKALRAGLAGLVWDSAPVSIERGEEGSLPTLEFTGTIKDVRFARAGMTMTVTDLADKLELPVASRRFAGTGGSEGPKEATGRTKRLSFGRVFNIEGRLLDVADSIYEFGDPAAPFASWQAVRDKGREGPFAVLDWQGSIASTLAALKASAPQRGGGVVAPSIACAKWWTQPAGPLTADITGTPGTGGAITVAAIADAISRLGGGPIVAFLAAASALRPAPAGLHIGSSGESFAQAIDRLVLGASLIWVPRPDGLIDLRPWSFDANAAVLQAEFQARERTFPPHRQRRVGYRRNERPHSDSEIAGILLDELLDGDTPIASEDILNSSQKWSDVSGAGKPADNATRNTGALADLNALDLANPDRTLGKLPVERADANLVNANQQWSQVSGAGKPADNATRNTGALANLDKVGAGQIDAEVGGLNQLADGSFENGFGGFAVIVAGRIELTRSTVQKQHGSHALRTRVLAAAAGSDLSLTHDYGVVIGRLALSEDNALSFSVSIYCPAGKKVSVRLVREIDGALAYDSANDAFRTFTSPYAAWHRFALTLPPRSGGGNTTGVQIRMAHGDNAAVGDIVYWDGAQLQIGDVATDFQPRPFSPLDRPSFLGDVVNVPGELKDGRIASGLDAAGDIKRPLPVPIKQASDLVTRPGGGGNFVGEMDADRTLAQPVVQRLDPATGRGDGRLLAPNLNYSARSLIDWPSVSYTVNGSNHNATISGGRLRSAWGVDYALPSATFPNLPPSTKHYLVRNAINPESAGESWSLVTDVALINGSTKISVMSFTTPASGSTGGGTTGGGTGGGTIDPGGGGGTNGGHIP